MSLMINQVDMSYVEIRIESPNVSLPDILRQSIVRELMPYRPYRVWIDEVVISNTGAGGAPSVSVAVFVDIGEKVASGILTAALLAGAARVLRLLKDHFPFRTLRLKIGRRGAKATYVPPDDDSELDAAIEAIPADYEITIEAQSVWRFWRDGRWEHREWHRTGWRPHQPNAADDDRASSPDVSEC